LIQLKNFSQAFATAAEVARSLEGDCTEHAVLLAALCRARKIPARVAFGLVYYPPQKGFAYHMWNEVWIADRWVPLDATLGLSGIGGDHIKLADSNLAGASAYSAMLPVIQVFGRLDLEVVQAE
jgi:transglutaminase/protease-like cytokinesis protein 3